MRYAVLGGGKRLRPFLLVECARLFGSDNEGVYLAAGALECLHVYSLIHDDLPCMDDDDLRRGKLAVHKQYDEAMAVLAGDALLTLAFEVLSDARVHQDANIRLKLMAGLAHAGGIHGMIGGQVIDIYAKNLNHDEELIRQLQALKTSALIKYAAVSGGQLAGASETDIKNMATYSEALGLAFQIRDDTLDFEGDAATMGKAVKKDAGLGKVTFVSIHGLENAKMQAEALGVQAKEALSTYGEKADVLRGTVDFVLHRQK